MCIFFCSRNAWLYNRTDEMQNENGWTDGRIRNKWGLICSLYLDGILLTIRKAAWYHFGRVCMYVCMSVCLSDDNFRKPWRTKFIFAHMWYISREYGSSSYTKYVIHFYHWVKVIRSQLIRSKFLFRRGKPSIGNNELAFYQTHTRDISMQQGVFFRVWRIEWCNCRLCHVTGSEHT